MDRLSGVWNTRRDGSVAVAIVEPLGCRRHHLLVLESSLFALRRALADGGRGSLRLER
jgi:hypothetical protein